MTEDTMQDVSHTPPYDTDANTVWQRGNEDEAADQPSPQPADD